MGTRHGRPHGAALRQARPVPWPMTDDDAEWLARLRAEAEAFRRDLDPATGPLADTLRHDLAAFLGTLDGDGEAATR